MKLRLIALAIAAFSLPALADQSGLWTQGYVAGGGGAHGANLSIGAGNKVDALEISSINLGRVSGTSTAKFVGISLVQNATPNRGFNWLFRIGIGKATTKFSDGAIATRMGLANGIFFGIGEQYQVTSNFALRAEAYRITYAANPSAGLTSVSYPVTLSAVLIF